MRHRLLPTITLLLLALLSVVPTALALPPSPELDMWNEGPVPVQQPGETDAAFEARVDAWIEKAIARLTWNCYNYGVNTQTTGAGGKPTRAHPGKGRKWPNLGVAITAADMCTKTRN